MAKAGPARHPVVGLCAVESADATFELVDKAGWTLPQAIRTISSAPAKAAGLTDRGAIAPGSGPTSCALAMADRLPVPRATFLEGRRVA